MEMSHLIRTPGWAVITLNTQTGHILCREDWRYYWTAIPPARPWAHEERRHFHHTIDSRIWRVWSNRIPVRVLGTHPFCRRFPTVHVEFDIRWVTAGGHWNVTVTRHPPNSPAVVWATNFAARTIAAHTADSNRADWRFVNRQHPAHEFGHTQPDLTQVTTPPLGTLDEYPATSPHHADTASIMHHGLQLRQRHMFAVLEELNRMFPRGDCLFKV
jgi:hypothetical protein